MFKMACHTAMGVALGLGFWLALALIDTSTLAVLIAHSSDPKTTTVILVSFFTLAFGVGATLTGFRKTGAHFSGSCCKRRQSIKFRVASRSGDRPLA